MTTEINQQALQLKEILEKKALSSGSAATFKIITQEGGTRDGQVQVVKTKPDGEIVVYQVS